MAFLPQTHLSNVFSGVSHPEILPSSRGGGGW